jgi:hypothetical protein
MRPEMKKSFFLGDPTKQSSQKISHQGKTIISFVSYGSYFFEALNFPFNPKGISSTRLCVTVPIQ